MNVYFYYFSFHTNLYGFSQGKNSRWVEGEESIIFCIKLYNLQGLQRESKLATGLLPLLKDWGWFMFHYWPSYTHSYTAPQYPPSPFWKHQLQRLGPKKVEYFLCGVRYQIFRTTLWQYATAHVIILPLPLPLAVTTGGVPLRPCTAREYVSKKEYLCKLVFF